VTAPVVKKASPEFNLYDYPILIPQAKGCGVWLREKAWKSVGTSGCGSIKDWKISCKKSMPYYTQPLALAARVFTAKPVLLLSLLYSVS
jgi:hypothetical protein